MNIMFIGKYPPIEGGESSKLYWLAKGLGEKGHKVTVISNSQEVEEQYKEEIPVSEMKNLKPKNVSFYSTNPFANIHFIPQYNPFSEKLTSLALDALEIEKPDIIVGWYLLPYAIAASNVSKMTKIPFMIQHAGSDLARILPNEYLEKYLKKILESADGILAYPSSVDYFRALGIKNVESHNVKIHPDYSPNNKIKETEKKALFLGKISKEKGIDYLINCFGKLTALGINLDIYGGGKIIEGVEKLKNVQHNKSVAPWIIPNIINSHSVLINPEHRFGIQRHTSRIPLEAICCGTPVILSRDIAQKMPYRNMKGTYLEIDPTNINEFAERIIEIIENQDIREKIKSEQNKAATPFKDFDGYISEMEEIFAKYVFRKP